MRKLRRTVLKNIAYRRGLGMKGFRYLWKKYQGTLEKEQIKSTVGKMNHMGSKKNRRSMLSRAFSKFINFFRNKVRKVQ